jgi:ribosomal protein S18 acetylase RimI-like enzyme
MCLSSAFKIREATPDDLAAIKEIIDLSFPRFFRFFAAHSVSDTKQPTILTEIDSSVVAFAKLTEFQVAARKYGCILWIAVHPHHRQKGAALALTKAGADYLKRRGAQAVFASTQRHNKAAQATLTAAEFKRIGFVGLARYFGWRVFKFYRDIWFAPGEIALILS